MATTNPSQRGGRYPYSNTGALITSGSVVVLVSGTSGKIGIALTDIAATTGTGELIIGGGGSDEAVQTLTKNTGEVFTDMQKLYWDVGNKRLTGTAGSNTYAGRSWGTYNSAAATAAIKVNEPQP